MEPKILKLRAAGTQAGGGSLVFRRKRLPNPLFLRTIELLFHAYDTPASGVF